MTDENNVSMMHDAITRLEDVSMPMYYLNYYNDILEKLQKNFELATKAKNKGLDVYNWIEPKIAYDLADRVAKMHNIDIRPDYVPCFRTHLRRKHT